MQRKVGTGFDLVVANILAPVIIQLSEEIANHMKPNTQRFIVTGTTSVTPSSTVFWIINSILSFFGIPWNKVIFTGSSVSVKECDISFTQISSFPKDLFFQI